MAIPYDKKTPHKFDIVGSFLRPERLHQARHAYEDGHIDAAALKAVEDECIDALIAKQKELGLGVITDGEFRRATWHLDFMWGFDGVTHVPTEHGLPFVGEEAITDDTYLVGKLALTHEHPFVEHFRYVAAREDERCVAKLTIPAPAQFALELFVPFHLENTLKIYAGDKNAVVDDLVQAYVDFIQQVYDAGCRNLQFDDCSWGALCDPKTKYLFQTDDAGLERLKDEFLEINNRVLDARPEGLTINTHICRGNFHSTYLSSGAYDAVATHLFAREHADNFFLEYDDERSGGFEPLAQIPAGKTVVLGLVTSKHGELEDRDAVIARIHEAAQYVPLENLALSPQCGFASCECGNILTEDDQWEKIKLIKSIAEEVWG